MILYVNKWEEGAGGGKGARRGGEKEMAEKDDLGPWEGGRPNSSDPRQAKYEEILYLKSDFEEEREDKGKGREGDARDQSEFSQSCELGQDCKLEFPSQAQRSLSTDYADKMCPRCAFGKRECQRGLLTPKRSNL